MRLEGTELHHIAIDECLEGSKKFSVRTLSNSPFIQNVKKFFILEKMIHS